MWLIYIYREILSWLIFPKIIETNYNIFKYEKFDCKFMDLTATDYINTLT